jgi:hypothetical protein
VIALPPAATDNAELWPLNEDNDGICRCSRLASIVVRRCEWHPAVQRRRLARLALVEPSRWRSELVNERATLLAILGLDPDADPADEGPQPGPEPPRLPFAGPFHRRCRARVEPNRSGLHGRCDLRAGHPGDHALERGMDTPRWSTAWTG